MIRSADPTFLFPTLDSVMKKLFLASFTLLAAAAAHADSTTYAIDPLHTFVTWEAKHMGTSTSRGRFDKKEGTITIDPVAKTGNADITIDIASITTGVPLLDTHLKGKDFFNAGDTPTARFEGNKFTFDGDKVTSVSGMLTMLGKTLPVTLKGTGFNCYENPMVKRQACGGDFETTITRSQWGMGYGTKFVSDDIRLLIQVEAIKQQ